MALVCGRQQLTYRELDRRSNRLARRLRALGVARDTAVAVVMARTPDLVVTLLAILKAGGAYVPIDPADPADRQAFMLRDSQASVLVTDGMEIAFDGIACNVKAEQAQIAGQSAAPLPPVGDHRDLAAIMYTSGSTGAPKGVMLEHSAGRLIAWLADQLMLDDLARVAATSSICFDPSMIEIFLPLSVGGCIILKRNLLEPFDADDQPTLIQGVPSVIDELAKNGAIPASVRVINVGGEALSATVAHRIYRGSRVGRLYNHYGPTEATVVATMMLVDRDRTDDPPIGTPVAGARIHLLDERGAPVAVGQWGEIHIAGGGLARGYWNRPDLTAARFVQEPGRRVGERMYRTGDLARLTEDGELIFIGRRERQVKIRGCRVELGEVEQALRSLPAIEDAAVTVIEDAGRRDRLVAFVKAGGWFDAEKMRSDVARWLPRYMVPSRIVAVRDFPRGSSGKVSHAALAALLPDEVETDSIQPDGRDSALEAIVAQEFARLLALPSVEADDDFFALGGDSLGAFQLAMALEDRVGRPISPAIVTQASTPRALSDLLDATAFCDESHLCLLAPGREGKAIFCLPGLSGEAFGFSALARVIESRAIYGLSPGSLTEPFVAEPDLHLLTEAYVEAILGVQPSGSYVIAGYSFGGIAAFDLARALERRGKRVTLILIDAFLGHDLTAPSLLLPWLARHGFTHLREEGGSAVLKRLLTSHWLPWGRTTRATPAWVSPRRRQFADAMIAATTHYQPTPFAGAAILITGGVRSAYEKLLDHDGRQGWSRWLAGDAVTGTVATTHLGLLQHPHVRRTAEIIEAELDRWQRASNAPVSIQKN
jgi:amino acid adenylation domain-containing protein